jgi:hypothetical protein
MTSSTNTPIQNNVSTENKSNDKELNFRALEAKYEKKVAEERSARLEAERLLQERNNVQDEDDDEPYVDQKKLDKKLAKFGQSTQQEIHKSMEMTKEAVKDELRKEMWLENNPDFYDILQHADKFAQKAPQLAESILRMPEGFERQKLVYQNIKAMGINQPEKKESSIQQKIDANKKSPYYQPSGMGTAPYASVADYSPQGQKQAYDKLQELKKNLRI